VLAGAAARVEDCRLPPGSATADAESTLTERGVAP
jgi:hypothetical protein